jgi:hypothetical protein
MPTLPALKYEVPEPEIATAGVPTVAPGDNVTPALAEQLPLPFPAQMAPYE